MKIVFLGTPDYVVPVLAALYKKYGRGESGISAVITQSPKEAGRKKFILRSPVDNWAFKHKIPVFYEFTDVPVADLGIAAAYGRIIPEAVIKKFKLGILNIHPSLLPQYRGAAPVQAAIARGDRVTGVTVFKIDAEVDHGPIVSQFKEEIAATDTTDSLRRRLFARAALFLIELLPSFLTGKVKPRQQQHREASYTQVAKREDGFVKPQNFAQAITQGKGSTEIERLVRALSPWPQVWTRVFLSGTKQEAPKRIKILKAHIEEGKLIPDLVQLEGKSVVSWKQFCQGYPNLTFTQNSLK